MLRFSERKFAGRRIGCISTAGPSRRPSIIGCGGSVGVGLLVAIPDIRAYYTFLYIAHVPPNLEDRRTANIMATATPALDRLSPAQAQPTGTYPEVKRFTEAVLHANLKA